MAIESVATNSSLSMIRNEAKKLTNIYSEQNGKGNRLVTTTAQVLAYQIARMPATFGASLAALQHTLHHVKLIPESMIDVGAGTGAAAWAANEVYDLKTITCLERETAMIAAGQHLMKDAGARLRAASWLNHDLVRSNMDIKADLVMASYVLNELKPGDRLSVLRKIWDATSQVLIVVCPGTPTDYQKMIEIRDMILKFEEASIVAPCPHSGPCLMALDDWCHFKTRIPRSRFHKYVKSGEVPYEDEKFTYMSIGRTSTKQTNARILRHPQTNRNSISLTVCTPSKIAIVDISKSDKLLYKAAKKAKCGDSIELPEKYID